MHDRARCQDRLDWEDTSAHTVAHIVQHEFPMHIVCRREFSNMDYNKRDCVSVVISGSGYERMSKLKSRCRELLMPPIVPTDTAS